MSSGWSPTGTLVIPGRSIRVKLRTCGEKIRRRMGSGLMPLLVPALLFVSSAMTRLMSVKSSSFSSSLCRNWPQPQLSREGSCSASM